MNEQNLNLRLLQCQKDNLSNSLFLFNCTISHPKYSFPHISSVTRAALGKSMAYARARAVRITHHQAAKATQTQHPT